MSMLLLSVLSSAPAHALEPFAVHTVDAVSGAPVPCVTLRTTNEIRWTSDANGAIAIVEPGLFGEEVWVHVEASGHGVDADFFGYEGATLDLREGGFARIELERRGSPAPCTAGDAHTRRLAEGYPEPAELYRVQVVDADSGRSVPLVGLTTPEHTYLTDSSGNVAVDHPDHLGADVTFTVASHGYHHAAGPLTLDAQPGGFDIVEVQRDMIAERLYRVTGQGIHRDTVLLGLTPPTAQPLLDGRVMGQDSSLTVPWGSELFWLWGDTNKPDYPLGLFATAGGRSPLSPTLDPTEGLDLAYQTDGSGFVRAMAPISDAGPVWLTALSVVADGGYDTPVAAFGVFDGLTAIGRGVAVYDHTIGEFVARDALPGWMPDIPHSEGLPWGDHVLLAHDYRTEATVDAWIDPASWEAWSPFTTGPEEAPVVQRDADGRPVYAWRPGALPALPEHVDAGVLAPDEVFFDHTRDPLTGARVEVHNRSVVFSEHRQRWLMFFTEVGGDSYLGEQWLALADTPLGPWPYARKVITHDRYTLYNPQVHVELSADPQHLLLEGTYTTFFAGSPAPTPRYDYNQLMFEVDLDHPDLQLPVPVYAVADDGTDLRTVRHLADDEPTPPVAFYALDRPNGDAVPLWRTGPSCDLDTEWATGGNHTLPPDLWVLPPDATEPGLVDLVWAHEPGDLDRRVFVEGAVPEGYTVEGPLGRAWPTPTSVDPPVLDWLAPVRVDAGPDRCQHEDDPVVLDASGSAGLTDATLSWTHGGTELATGMHAEVELPEGRYPITLTATLSDGTVREDHLWVLTEDDDPNLTDHPEAADTDADDGIPNGVAEGDGCGCASPGSGAGVAWVLVSAFLVRRGR